MPDWQHYGITFIALGLMKHFLRQLNLVNQATETLHITYWDPAVFDVAINDQQPSVKLAINDFDVDKKDAIICIAQQRMKLHGHRKAPRQAGP